MRLDKLTAVCSARDFAKATLIWNRSTTANGILWRFRTGSTWAEVPERYGPSTTCYNRFVRWRKAGVWDRLLAAVSAAFEGEIVMIDSTCVRVHQHGATGKKGAPEIAAWDVPEAASRARSMPSLTLTVVPSHCA